MRLIKRVSRLTTFNCIYLQALPYSDLMSKTLVFAIYDFDRFSKHDQIGEVKIPLCQIDLAQTIEDWKELQSVEGEGGQVILNNLQLYIRQNICYFIYIIYYTL